MLEHWKAELMAAAVSLADALLSDKNQLVEQVAS